MPKEIKIICDTCNQDISLDIAGRMELKCIFVDRDNIEGKIWYTLYFCNKNCLLDYYK